MADTNSLTRHRASGQDNDSDSNDGLFIAQVIYQGKPYWIALHTGALFPDDGYGEQRSIQYLKSKLDKENKERAPRTA